MDTILPIVLGCVTLIVGFWFRKLVFSIVFGQILSCSYYTIHSWLYQLTVMVSTYYILAPKLLAVHTLELAFSDQLWVM